MSTVFDILCEDYFLFSEYVQGNLFNGLEYFEVVEETLWQVDGGSIVFMDEILETIEIAEDFSPSHAPYCILIDDITFDEQFGFPVNCYQSIVQVIHEANINPIETCAVIVEILHGPNTYYEEPYSNIHLVEWTQAVNYYFEYVYESVRLLMEPWDGRIDWTIHFNYYFNDLINMRHNVTQWYYFNSLSEDKIGISPKASFGFHHLVASEFWSLDSAQNKVGKVVSEFINIDDRYSVANWLGNGMVNDTLNTYDLLDLFRGYMLDVESGINVEVNLDILGYMIHLLDEELHLFSETVSPAERFHVVREALKLVASTALVAAHKVQVGDAIELDPTTDDVYIVGGLVEDGFSLEGAHTLLNIYVALLDESIDLDGGVDGD